MDCGVARCSCAYVANTVALPNLYADPMDQRCCNMPRHIGSSCAAIYVQVQVQAGYCNCCWSTWQQWIAPQANLYGLTWD